MQTKANILILHAISLGIIYISYINIIWQLLQIYLGMYIAVNGLSRLSSFPVFLIYIATNLHVIIIQK